MNDDEDRIHSEGAGDAKEILGPDHSQDAARLMMAQLGGMGAQLHDCDDDDDDDDHGDIDDEEDETLGERLLGLTEMLPSSIRNATANILQWTWSSSKWLLRIGKTGMWVVASSATILALPVLFESERTQIEEQQLSQQRQLMLGPNAAMSGSGGHAAGMMHGGPFPQVSPPGS